MAAPITRAIPSGADSTKNKTVKNSRSENGFCIVTSNANGSSTGAYRDFLAIAFDSVTSTRVQKTAEVSSYAVENSQTGDSSEVSDHIQIKNGRINLEGIVSETPIAKWGGFFDSAGEGNRIAAAIDALDKIFTDRKPIVVYTEHKIFKNMVITGFDYDYTAEEAMKFTLQLDQIRLITGATVNAIATKTASTLSVGKKVKTQVSTKKVTQASIGNRNVTTN